MILPRPLRFAAALLLLAGPPAHAEGPEVGLPYNQVNLAMKLLKSKPVQGVACVAWYVKDNREGQVLDPAQAKFRVRTVDGAEVALEIEALRSIPAEQLSDVEKKLIADAGPTHRLWIPKNDKRFKDGQLVHSMAKGSVSIVQGIGLSTQAAAAPNQADKAEKAEKP